MTNSVSRNQGKPLRCATAVLLLAFGVRSLFWLGLPHSADVQSPYFSSYFKGDARLFLDQAQALRDGTSFERDLPLRAPGTSYLVAAIGGKDPEEHTRRLRLAWIGLDSLAAALFFLAARRRLGAVTGWAVGLWCATSTPWLLLSTTLSAETPYLALLGLLFVLDPAPGTGAGSWRLSIWGALHGLSCLFRPEHLLLTLPWLGWRGWRWHRWEPPSAGRRLAAVTLGFLLVLTPWHLKLWKRIREFHTSPPEETASTQAIWDRVEEATRHVRWTEGAVTARGRLPAAIRRPLAGFVSATADWRGLSQVDERFFEETLHDAFGSVPEALPARPFVTLTGGLNFYLANQPESRGRFDRGPLDEPPPLAGGARRFPPVLVHGLPPPDLSLSYPPHFEAVARGWRLGWRETRGSPRRWLGLVGAKLTLFWSGAAGGFTGFGLPGGMSGIRPPVDLLVPRGPAAAAWRILVLVFATVGLVVSRSRPEIVPWLLLLVSRALVAVLFFGYARHGALVAPVIAVLVTHSIRASASALPLRFSIRPRPLHLWIGAGILLAVELLHGGASPRVRVEEAQATTHAPGAGDTIPEVRIETRYLWSLSGRGASSDSDADAESDPSLP